MEHGHGFHPVFAIATGVWNHSFAALRKTKECVIAIPTIDMLDKVVGGIEPLKPSNTGWLIAGVVQDTFAFGWAGTETDPTLRTVQSDPQWRPYVVLPGEYAVPERVVHTALPPELPAAVTGKRPLFNLLVGTWSEALKMHRVEVPTSTSCRAQSSA
jgi:DTW domain-containing protein YfiP